MNLRNKEECYPWQALMINVSCLISVPKVVVELSNGAAIFVRKGAESHPSSNRQL
jgi:hypothetical protein